MGKKRGRTAYTNEFRREAVRLVERDPERLAQIARELDVHRDTLRQWVRRGETRPDGPIVPVTRALPLEEENRQLRRENERLREEREILKKAAAFFAKDTR
jgi:transposase